MKHYIFTIEQRDVLLNIFKDIIYTQFQSQFQFIEIKNNRWVLPETVRQSEDVLRLITADNKSTIDGVIGSVELRDLVEEDLIKNSFI